MPALHRQFQKYSKSAQTTGASALATEPPFGTTSRTVGTMCSVHGHGDDTEAARNDQQAPSVHNGCQSDDIPNDKCKAYFATVRHGYWKCTCMLIVHHTSVRTEVEEKLSCMYNDQRRGDSWKLNDLRAK